MPELGLAGPFARLRHTAMRLGITVLDGAAGDSPWPDESTAAIVAFGRHIALKPGLDDALHTDVLAMALIVAAVMGSTPAGHPCAITAPSGLVLISQARAARGESGPGKLATLLARKCGRDTASAAFEYTTPAITDPSPWAPWIRAADPGRGRSDSGALQSWAAADKSPQRRHLPGAYPQPSGTAGRSLRPAGSGTGGKTRWSAEFGASIKPVGVPTLLTRLPSPGAR